MLNAVRARLTYANVVATLALFVALGGGAYAALGRDSIHATQLAPNSVGASEISAGAVRSSEIASGAVGSSEATGLKPKDLGFTFGAAQDYVTNALNLNADVFTTIATRTITPSKPGFMLIADCTASVRDGGQYAGPSHLTYRLLVDGVPQGQTYSLYLGDGESELDSPLILAEAESADKGGVTVDLQLRSDQPDVSVNERSLTLLLEPAPFGGPFWKIGS